jgi:hypothetical protein
MEDERRRVHFPAVLLSPRVRVRLAVLLFFVAWFVGAAALNGGLKLGAEVRAAYIFAIACVLWWISYRVCRSANGSGMTLGFLTLGLWMLHLVGALFFDFHRYVADLFFWTSTAIFLVLILLVALSDPASVRPKASASPD